MVSRSMWQRMLEWVQTSTPSDTDPAGDKTDEILEEQPIKDPEKAQSLIAIENARSERDLRLAEPNWTNRLRILALAGAICLIALMILVAGAVAGAVFVVDKAARLKLSRLPHWHEHSDLRLRQSFGCGSLAGGAGSATPTGGAR